MNNKQAPEPTENPYDSLPRAEKVEAFFAKEKSGRRDYRDFADSISRLLPVPKGGTPMTQEMMRGLFRGKSGKQRREERAARREAKRQDEEFRRAHRLTSEEAEALSTIEKP